MSDHQSNMEVFFVGGPLISVGIPTYNRPEGLRRTLECITGQTYKNLEIIVSDNCSLGPETEQVVQEYINRDSRIQYFRQEKNMGIAFNFQFVLKQATGEFFMWASDDDEWDISFIQTCLRSCEDVGTVMTNNKICNRNTNQIIQNSPLDLITGDSRYQDVQVFLKNLRPSVIYGLHKKESLHFITKTPFFDFFDCYFGLRQILYSGLKILPHYLYTAGIDTESYTIKPMNPTNTRLLQYSPFLMNSMKEIMLCPHLRFMEKMNVIITLLSITSDLFCGYEEKYRKKTIRFIHFIKGGMVILKRILPIPFHVQNTNLKNSTKVSYSQSGEDLIIKFIFDALKIQKPFYLDIGAHHPYILSNTALFYELGSNGINIEPNPELLNLFKKNRPRDINLNIGISSHVGELPYYMMSAPTMNTFSKEVAEDLCTKHKFRIVDILKIKVNTISNIQKEYFNEKNVDLLTIDVEGEETEILKDIDYVTFYPTVICIETISYSGNGNGIKNNEIIHFLEQKGYLIYADTYINTIFVRKDQWLNH